MKRILAAAAAAAIMLTFASCGGNDETEPLTQPATEPYSETETAPVETESFSEPEAEPVMGSVDLSQFDSLSGEKQEFWFGRIGDDGFPQIYHDPMRELIEKYGGIVFGDTGKKEITLTFDCGYEYENLTESILDTLKEKGVHAVFFVTMDYVEDNAGKVRRMIDEGHTVGNHSTTHPDFSQCSSEEIEDEIFTLHDYVKENFGYDMEYIRFPEGSFSERALAVTQALGYRPVFWSFAYADWDTSNQKSPEEALAAVTAGMHRGAVPLLHAVSKTNSEILGEYIDTMRSEGYTFIDI